MASIVELDESNGSSETVTHAVGSLAMGTVDAPNMVPGASGARQGAGTNSISKMLRFHLTALGGGLGITNLRVYCDPSATGWTLHGNAHTNQGTYNGARLTSYVAPDTDTAKVPTALPVSDPGTANLGIGGTLAASLSAPGWSDYLRLQLRAASGVVASFSSPAFFAYDDVG